jgi:hypothetical protein
MILWFENKGTAPEANEHSIFLLSSTSSTKCGMVIHKKNFRKFIALSTAKGREVIGRGDWILNHNLYLAPKDEAP